MIKQALYQKAMSQIASRRQKAITQALAQEESIRSKLPQLAPLEQASTKAGIRAAQLAASGASPEAVEQALAQLRSAEAVCHALLTQHGFSQSDLLPQFTCPICKDTGFSGGIACSCVRALMRRLRQVEMDETSPLSLCSFASFSLDKYPQRTEPDLGITVREHMAQILEYCRAWATHFSPTSESLYLCGYAGLGKTHLALAMAREVLEQDYDVVYISAQDAFNKAEKERFGGTGDTLTALQEAELLILDDLGTEYISAYVSACLYSLINTRSNKRLPTIYTSNIVSDSDLRRRYTEKIASRLLGSCEVLSFCGDDVRLAQKT